MVIIRREKGLDLYFKITLAAAVGAMDLELKSLTRKEAVVVYGHG